MIATSEATNEVKPEMIDITPLPHMLFSMGATNMPWWKSLAELVDNSFDAKATRVKIQRTGKTVAISDDGRGIPNIGTAIRMGGHDAHGGQCLGRYGVGLKEAWLSAGDRIEITTSRNGTTSHLDFSKDAIEYHNGLWMLPTPKAIDTGSPSGTKIVLHLRDGKNPPGNDAWEMLSWAFTPAMGLSKQILAGTDKKQQLLQPCKFPSLSESVHETFDVCGRSVTITIGILAPGESIFKGPFWVQYGHRNIVGSSIGVGDFSDSNMAGTITLKEGWKLTKNKDDFDDLKDELAPAIHERIKSMLIKAEQMSEDVESSAMTKEIAGMLNAAIANPKREKRNQTREQSGTVRPAATGRKRRSAAKIDPSNPGSVEISNRKTGFSISWNGNDDGRVGEYDYHANRVKLNLLHPFVKAQKDAKNIKALYCLAAAVLSDHHCYHDGPSRLLIADKDFSLVFSALTKTIGGVE